jgi:hypothetical protein
METIINYKIKDFFQLKDEKVVSDYLMFLELLNPLNEIANPNYKWYKRSAKKLQIKPVISLTFGDVAEIRNNFNTSEIYGIIDSIKKVTDLTDKQVLNFTITTFYGIISYIKSELFNIVNMENNALYNDDFDINLEAVNANERMGKFGVLNLIDSLAKEDILKWKEIEKLPYLTVFTKLVMDNEKHKIQKEITELQKKKNNK